MIEGQQSTARQEWGRTALVGATGFVGGVLSRAVSVDAAYASATIDTITGEAFDTVVCAGAPAAMWKANADPEGDRRNLDRLIQALSGATIGRLVLISTIAVLADPSSGADEDTEVFETATAYGRNRRGLEMALGQRFDTVVLRLPALFGPGLKKNFLFDLRHPAPSFLKPDAFADLCRRLSDADAARLGPLYGHDSATGLLALDRARFDASAERDELNQAIVGAGFAAARFTHADTTFQFYGLRGLAGDIDRAISLGLSTLHLATEPWRAGDLHERLTGRAFDNTGPAARHEDMRTRHATAFGTTGPYLKSREAVLEDIRAEWEAGAW